MKKNLLLLLCIFCMLKLTAQTKTYWKALTESDVSKSDIWSNKFKPADYKIFHLDETVLRNELRAVVSEKEMRFAKNGTVISIPDAEGNLKKFSVYESLLMQPKLAAKYKSIKTYIGKGVDDASAIVHFSITSSGFDAVVTATGKQTLYINALDAKNNVYAVSARNEKDVNNGFKCSLDESIIKKEPSASKASTFTGNADDGMLRTYRLALCVNGEFSQFFLDGTEADTAAMKEKVMDVLITVLEKANAVYERDFSVRMVYVDNEDTLIYLDPAADPWPKLSGNAWNNKTQAAIDQRIGSANYDIGHLLGKVPTFNDNNGNAGCIGCVCDDSQKGSGFTAYNDPSLTDYMVIDYWTHEVGHQFGANHTFTFQPEGTEAQVEPGSGSTIMGYAGITGSTDVQSHSDDLFSVVSIAQNTTYVKSSAGSCGVATSTGNNVPVVKAGSNKTIPKSTPFALTGSATDVDGDALSYIWEQVDILQSTSNTFPKPKSKSGPVFRTFNYSTDTVRYFPEMQYILDGSLGWKWEALPGVFRRLSFRFTARDNHAGGGSNKSAAILITVDSTAGPFKITTENKTNAETWNGNETKTITWDVSNTDVAPVNCASVNILLSTDGGLTFPTTLAFKTANDGTEDIVVPNLSTTQARIKIEAAGNYFFTINDTDFAIQSVLPVSWLSFTAQKINNASVLVKWSTTNEYNNKYYEVQRSVEGVNFSSIGQLNAGNHANAVEQYSYTDFKALGGADYYRIKQIDANGNSSYSAIAKVILDDNSLVWTIQPNPVKNAAAFYARRNMTNVSINLYNAAGKNVFSTQRSTISAGEQIVIPVSNLAKGVYFVKVKSAESNKTEKIVVE